MGQAKQDAEREYKQYDEFAIDEGIKLYNSYCKHFARYCAPHSGDWDSMPVTNKLVWIKSAIDTIRGANGQ